MLLTTMIFIYFIIHVIAPYETVLYLQTYLLLYLSLAPEKVLNEI